MGEWGVVGVIVVLVGLVTAIVKPLISLTNTITKLTVVVDALQGDMAGLTRDNSDSHKELWKHNNKQDGILADHEGRIGKLEYGRETR